ncbi:hypothetical protein Btru_008126 [Bulinus truncatus]|nr:hypothetical protein Btru_008126 [Bulinus truncatus]
MPIGKIDQPMIGKCEDQGHNSVLLFPQFVRRRCIETLCGNNNNWSLKYDVPGSALCPGVVGGECYAVYAVLNWKGNAGVHGKSNAGVHGKSNAGVRGKGNAGVHGKSNAGVRGKGNAGVHGKGTAGIRGKSNAGVHGMGNAGEHRNSNAGYTGRVIQGYVGRVMQGYTGWVMQGYTGWVMQGIMASASDLAAVKQTLLKYKERTETTDCLKLTPFIKCIEACNLKQYKTNIEASIWPLFQDKAKKVSTDKIATELINELAADVIAKKRKQTKGRAPVDDPEVQALANEIRAKIAAKAGEETKAAKVDATTARLTDVSGYTGSHKERFAADGKGKGKDGRVDQVENSGYVGNYKGAGSYDKAH